MSGRLQQRSYETREGEKRTVIELDVDEVGPSLRYATAKVNRTQRGSSTGGGFGGGSGGGAAPVAAHRRTTRGAAQRRPMPARSPTSHLSNLHRGLFRPSTVTRL